MEIYDNRTETRGTPDGVSANEPFAAAVAMPAQDSASYWKFCSVVLGAALLIAIVLGSGPGSASANDSLRRATTQNGEYEHPALVQPVLSIGGFDAVEGVPVFVMVDQTGQRVGVMEMPGKNAPQD